MGLKHSLLRVFHLQLYVNYSTYHATMLLISYNSTIGAIGTLTVNNYIQADSGLFWIAHDTA